SLVSLQGGLDSIADRVTLFSTPGKTVKMVNFEGGIRGGYRRISGYTKYSALSPDGIGTNHVHTARSYFNGCVAFQNGDVYFSQTGASWIHVNKDTGDTFVDEATLAGLGSLTRTTGVKEKYHMAHWHNGTEEELYFVDTAGVNPIGRLVIRDNAGTIEFKYQHADDTHWGAGNQRYPTRIQMHGERLVVCADPTHKNELYYSDLLEPLDFIGGGVINISDDIEWAHTFRENLIIFAADSIKAVAGLGDPDLQNIETITNDIGCPAGESIQEVAGGLIFLAPDGLRTVSATDRIDDFELGTLTTNIHDEILDIIESLSECTVSSTTIRGRNQYRLFCNRPGNIVKGVGGVIRKEGGLEWNTFQDYPVFDLQGARDEDNLEVIFQSNDDGFVYLHDTGSTFDGVNIIAYFQTPEMVMEDPNTRKTLSTVEIYTDMEGPIDYSFKILFDEDLQNAASPGLYALDTTQAIAVYDVSEYDAATAVYDAGNARINRVHVQGSGRFVSFIFQSRGGSAPFTIQSLNISYFLNGRY
ncbi:MAG: hypothetical protein V3S69_06660, partial [Dehalococcoidales bacterium]